MEIRQDENLNKNVGFNAVNAGNAFTLSVVFLLFFSIVLSILTITLKIEGDICYFLNFVPAPLSVICTLLALYLRGQKNCFKLLIPKKASGYSVISALLIILGLMFGLSTLNEYFVKAIEYLISLIKGSQVAISVPELPAYSTKNLIFAILFVCIIPTITEELLMRKIVLDGLKEVGEVFAVFIGGLLFSIFHMNPAQTVYQFIVGSAFCYVALKGGNYLVTMLAHFINNLFIVLNYYFFKITFNPIMEIIVTVLGVACFIIGLIILYKKGEKLKRGVNKNAMRDFLISVVLGVIICVSMWISVLVG